MELRNYRLVDALLQRTLRAIYRDFDLALNVSKNADPDAEYVKVVVYPKNPNNQEARKPKNSTVHHAPPKAYTFFFSSSEVIYA